MGRKMWLVRVCEGWFDAEAGARKDYLRRPTQFETFTSLSSDVPAGFGRILGSVPLPDDVTPVDDMWAKLVNYVVVLRRVRAGYRSERIGDLTLGAWGLGVAAPSILLAFVLDSVVLRVGRSRKARS